MSKCDDKWALELDRITHQQYNSHPSTTSYQLKELVEPRFKLQYPGNFSLYWSGPVDDGQLHSSYWGLLFYTPEDKTFWILKNSQKI